MGKIKALPGVRRRWTRRVGVLLASVGMAGAALVMAQPAAAVQSTCASGEMCWHYNSAQNGYNATYGRTTNLASVNPGVNGGIYYYYYIADSWGSAGAGQNVWNNAGGARNRHSTRIMLSHVNSNYTGGQDAVGASTARTLSVTYNDNASMRWAP